MNFSNPYFALLIITFVVVHVIEMISTFLNVRALRPELPAAFEGVYDRESYRKSQDYTRESSRFDMISSTLKLIIFLAFWLGGGFGWFDSLLRSWHLSVVVQGLVGISLLYLGNTLINLPFDLIDTFVIEQKHGFNKTTPKTFVGDQIKGLVIGAVLGLPLIALLLWVFESYPNAWIYAWLSTTAFILVMSYVGPAIIMPLFNKFTPLEDGELKTEVTAMAERCGFPFKEVSIIDGSKRSSRSNAFFAGFGKNKKIALYDTLVAQQTVPELVAVLAHEIGHFKRKHIIQRLVLSVIQMAVLFFLLGKFLKNPALFEAFGVAETSTYLSFVFFLMLFQPIQFVLGIVMSWWSRKHEYEADAYASAAVGGPQDLISALRKLARDNLANLTPHPFHVFLHYSHPPLQERLAAMKR
jgi:STE24 endopeptidase